MSILRSRKIHDSQMRMNFVGQVIKPTNDEARKYDATTVRQLYKNKQLKHYNFKFRK